MLKNELRKFFIKLLWFTLTVGVADQLMGVVLSRTYFSQRQGLDYQTTEVVRNTKAGTLSFGSSRALNIISPERMRIQLGDSFFNAGMDGQSILYQTAVLEAVLHRYKPRRVILCVDAGGFIQDRRAYDRLSRLLPYYYDDPAISNALRQRSSWEGLKMLSGIYPFNSKLLDIIKGITGRNLSEKGTDGFIPLDRIMTAPPPIVDYTKPVILDTVKINACKRFLQLCQSAGTKVYMICPPYRVKAVGTDTSLQRASNLAHEMGIPYLDFFADAAFLNKDNWFADFRHLNATGAAAFTDTVAARIRQIEKP